MSRKWFWVRGLAALAIVVTVVLGGYAVYRISWSQGYQAGQIATGAEVEVSPLYPYPRFVFPGGFLTVGLILLMLIVVGKTFRFLFWSAMIACGLRPMGRHWSRFHHHRHHPRPPKPPWFWDWEEPSEEGSEDANADSDQAES